MDFSKNGIKKILALGFTFVISAQILMAQTEKPVVYLVNFISDYEMEVSINVDKNATNFSYYIFPERIPNFYKKTSFRNEISDFKIAINEQLSSYYASGDTIFLPPNFKGLSYKVHLDSLEKTAFLPVQSAAKGNLKLLNIPTFLGYLNSAATPIQLSISKNGEALYTQLENYFFFQENPICIGCKKLQLPLDTFTVSIESYQTILEHDVLIDYIKDAFNAFEFLKLENEFEQKKIIIIADTLSKNTGAIAHENTIVFYVNEVNEYVIRKTIIHELIHWSVPDLKSWLNEGVAEFLAIKLMRKAALISDEAFLNIMSGKMREAALFKDYSLTALYQNETRFTAEENYSALYSKGALMAWLLDLVIFEHSNKKLSLESYVLGGIDLNDGVNHQYLIEKIISFENDMVLNNQNFSYNQFLNYLGILFEENKITEVKAVQNILLEKNGKEIIILDNGGVNLLSENDVILSVDREKNWDDIKQVLACKNSKKNIFLVLRNGEKKKIKINGSEKISIRKRFFLSFFETLTSEQKANWLAYLN